MWRHWCVAGCMVQFCGDFWHCGGMCVYIQKLVAGRGLVSAAGGGVVPAMAAVPASGPRPLYYSNISTAEHTSTPHPPAVLHRGLNTVNIRDTNLYRQQATTDLRYHPRMHAGKKTNGGHSSPRHRRQPGQAATRKLRTRAGRGTDSDHTHSKYTL